jgi:hypothetical protein
MDVLKANEHRSLGIKVRTIPALAAAIAEAERLQLDCPEVDEARRSPGRACHHALLFT